MNTARPEDPKKSRPPPPTRGSLVLVRSSREESEEGGLRIASACMRPGENLYFSYRILLGVS